MFAGFSFRCVFPVFRLMLRHISFLPGEPFVIGIQTGRLRRHYERNSPAYPVGESILLLPGEKGTGETREREPLRLGKSATPFYVEDVPHDLRRVLL